MSSQVLCIGQSDSCAGTGIQADLKTVQAFGGYASTILTAVSVQNTMGVHAIHPIPTLMVKDQMDKVMEDLKPGVVKTGMLANIDTINMLGDVFDEHGFDGLRVVIDPVMTNRSGSELLDKDGRDAFKRRLLIHADVLTPNLEEAYTLSGIEVKDVEDMLRAADTLRTLGANAVILKGGGLSTSKVIDIYADGDTTEVYENERIDTRSTHGAGSTLSAGIAVGLAQGLDTRAAYERARAFVNIAMKEAKPIGGGYGPLNHCVTPPA